MLEFCRGNILDSQAYALVNTVNTVGIMGKGIALQFKLTFPANYAIYRNACSKDEIKIGALLIVKDVSLLFGERLIINFPTKTHWRLPSAYSYIISGLKALHRYLVDNPQISIAMPALGCGNGDLEWSKVKPIITEQLSDLKNHITVYEPE